MRNLRACIVAFVGLGVLTAGLAAQGGGKPVTGNPTPGTEQPAPPNLADRVTAVGCLQRTSERGVPPSSADANTVVDSRFELTAAERQNNLPVETGGSSIAAAATGRTYRLAALESQLSPFIGAKVEISGEVLQRSGQKSEEATPTLQVEFVQRLAEGCR